MLYALRHYTGPLLLALAIHGLAVAALLRGFNPQPIEARAIKPQIVRSELIVLEAKAKPAAAKPPELKPMRNAPPPPAAKPKPKPQPRTEPPAEQPKPKPDEQAQARERARKEAEEREARLKELAEQQFLDALASEAADLDAAAAADSDAETAQSYRVGIYQAVVGNWSRPPSARLGMQALLRVELVPTGEIVSVTVVESSGSAAFDRSAEAAVNKARRFEVPKESAIFERYFRQFTLLFKPEDLLR